MSRVEKQCNKCRCIGYGNFCALCGSELSVRVACKCGYNDIWPHEKFCPECGAPVEGREEKVKS